jgi:hypothetical protein
MTIPMQTNLMARIGYHTAFFGESLEGVAGDEPGGFDVVFGEHFEHAADADGACEETCTDRG